MEEFPVLCWLSLSHLSKIHHDALLWIPVLVCSRLLLDACEAWLIIPVDISKPHLHTWLYSGCELDHWHWSAAALERELPINLIRSQWRDDILQQHLLQMSISPHQQLFYNQWPASHLTNIDRCLLPCSTAEAGAWQTAIVVLCCRSNGVIAAHCLHNDSNRF